MPRIESINQRYAASASLARHGTEVISVRDDLGARFDSLSRALFRLTQRDGPGVWDQLSGAAKALRWRLITGPMPIERNAEVQEAAVEVSSQASRLMGAVDEQVFLQEISEAAGALLMRDPLVGDVLLESLAEVGVDSAIVVAASTRSREALSGWLAPMGARVLTLGDLERADVSEDIAYFVGPPRIFKAAAVTAPRTPEVSFLIPAWFGDRSVPTSMIAQHAEGPILVSARLTEVGDGLLVAPMQETVEEAPIPEESLLPQLVWGNRKSEDRAPNADESEARKVLLAGNRAIWLDDDGERIRTFDPSQPPGERVGYSDVSLVNPGTFLLLREGETEREVLLRRALTRIGMDASAVQYTQALWKSALAQQLQTRGTRESERMLRHLGVRAAAQVRVWASPHMIRPQSDKDFVLLLGWLGVPVQSCFGHASILRQEVHRATRDLRALLESAADVSDIRELERAGHMTLDLDEPGYRGMIATKVVAIAPFTELITRSRARVLFEDEGAQWLE